MMERNKGDGFAVDKTCDRRFYELSKVRFEVKFIKVQVYFTRNHLQLHKSLEHNEIVGFYFQLKKSHLIWGNNWTSCHHHFRISFSTLLCNIFRSFVFSYFCHLFPIREFSTAFNDNEITRIHEIPFDAAHWWGNPDDVKSDTPMNVYPFVFTWSEKSFLPDDFQIELL